MTTNPLMITQDYLQTLQEPQLGQLLQDLDAEYDFDLCIKDTYTQEIDHIINLVLAIEDEIRQRGYQENAEKATATKQLKAGMPKLALARIHTPKGEFDSIKDAAAAHCYAQRTIITYLTTQPDVYYRIE